MAKILLIGRVYAAAIERRKLKKKVQNDEFYIRTVAPKIMNSPIDQWIETAKRTDPTSRDALQAMVELHGRTTDLFGRISGLQKRSLASKYLHFHVPRLFFIYDSRAVQGMRAVSSNLVGRVSSCAGKGDGEYRTFAEKCWQLKQHCAAQFDIHLSPRELDNLLLFLSEK